MGRRAIVLIPLLAIALGLVACGGSKSSNAKSATAGSQSAATTAPMEAATGMGEAQSAEAPNCGAVQAVWVNLNTKVYHEPGDPMYGKTKHGKYLCPAQAKAQGFHPAGGAMSHRQKKSASQM
ncbi:MAG: hypothetical protein WA814_08690 [Candidatus Baltobacteraceae bacterium]